MNNLDRLVVKEYQNSRVFLSFLLGLLYGVTVGAVATWLLLGWKR